MILGTHNSLSYAKPTKWWMRLINFTSKCQDLTIEQQWNYGVRFFDIRIKPYGIRAYHGLIEYNVTVFSVLSYLDRKAKESGEKCYVAINLEEYIEDHEEMKIYEFKQDLLGYKQCYPNLTICGGYCKGPWRQIVPEISNPETADLYWEFMNWKDGKFNTKWQRAKKLFNNIIHFSPKYWAKRDNKYYKKLAEEQQYDVLCLDFIQL